MSDEQTDNRPWWRHSKKEQKSLLISEVRHLLSHDADLPLRRLYFLSEALDGIDCGLFGLSAQALTEYYLPDERFAEDYLHPADTAGLSRSALLAKLDRVEREPVQERPIFGKIDYTGWQGRQG